jgi:hypothetical protein
MHTHRFFVFAAPIAIVVGCAPLDREDISSDGEASLSTSQDRYVLLRPEAQGFTVHELNRGTEVTVADVQLSVADDEVDRLVRSAPDGELVVRGHLDAMPTETRAPVFVVSEAYRGMPGMAVGRGDSFFTVNGFDCTSDGCSRLVATWLNLTEPMEAGTLNLTQAAKPFVDAAWLRERVLAHGALVAATLSGNELVASQVFVRLPDALGPCPTVAAASCTGSTVPTFAREAGRCLLPTGCSEPGECLMRLPVCEPGYTLHSWMAGSPACPAYACDPSFVSTR